MRKRRLALCALGLVLACYCAFAQSGPVNPVLVPGKSTWPAKEIPSVIPDYKGKVANYGNGGSTNWFQIYLVETNEAKVRDYVAGYGMAGWTLSKDGSSDKATKDQYEVLIHFYRDQGLVGITISIKSTDKQWPTKDYPFIPQFSQCLSSSIRDYEFNVTIDVKQAKEADIAAYKRSLAKLGWEGDPEGEEFHWGKDGLDTTLQITDQGGQNWFFDISK